MSEKKISDMESKQVGGGSAPFMGMGPLRCCLKCRAYYNSDGIPYCYSCRGKLKKSSEKRICSNCGREFEPSEIDINLNRDIRYCKNCRSLSKLCK